MALYLMTFYATNFKNRSNFKHQTCLFVKTWYLTQTLDWSKKYVFFFSKNENALLLSFQDCKNCLLKAKSYRKVFLKKVHDINNQTKSLLTQNIKLYFFSTEIHLMWNCPVALVHVTIGSASLVDATYV